MSKILLSFLLILSFVCPLLAQEVDTAWVRRYNGPENLDDDAFDIAVDGSDNVYVTGISHSSITSLDYATVKYYPTGDTAWVRKYNGPANDEDFPRAVAVDGYGNVYVTGYSYGSGTDRDYATMKYYPNGDTAWVRRYNGPGNSWDEARSIAVDDSGNIYVTGYTTGEGTYFDYTTIKYNPNGDTVWLRRYHGSGQNDYAYAIAVDASGNIYVTGGSGDGLYLDFLTIKYNSKGDVLWVKRYKGPEDYSDWSRALAIDDYGNIYVTGASACCGGYYYDYATLKYNPNGDTVWTRRYDGPGKGDDVSLGVAVDSYGNVYVAGYSYGKGTSYDYATVKYYPNGDTAWVRRYNGSASDFAYAIALDASDNIYVTGGSDGSGTYRDYATLKYCPNGDTAWVRTYNGSGNWYDEAHAITIDNSGNVYVTGGSGGSGKFLDYATIKYVQFLRGDADGDDSLSLSDIVYIINYLFKKGPAPYPIKAGDCNCDGKVSLTDIVYLIVYLFKSGPPPGC